MSGVRSRPQRVTKAKLKPSAQLMIALLTADPANRCLRAEAMAFRREGLVCAPGRSEETGHEHLRFDHEQDLPPWGRIRQFLGRSVGPAGGERSRTYRLLGRSGIDSR